jgi:hypothetical protein
MASKPMEKGKRLKSYNDAAGATDKLMLEGSEEGKATTSQMTTAPVHPDWMMLWSGARIKQRGATEMSLRHDTGTGNTVTIWSQVCMGTGTGCKLLYPGNTVPVFMVLQIHQCQYFGQVSNHLILLNILTTLKL